MRRAPEQDSVPAANRGGRVEATRARPSVARACVPPVRLRDATQPPRTLVERIQQPNAGASEIVDVARDDRQIVDQRGGRDQLVEFVRRIGHA